jgi:hypothetical protein
VTASRVKVACLVYGALVVASGGWGLARGNADLYHHPHPGLALGPVTGILVGIVSGIVVGVLVVAASRHAVRRWAWARTLHVEFRQIFGPLRTRDVLFFALVSALGEELFFRGALQPTIGLAASSVVFGLLHLGPTRRFAPWTGMAIAMGFVLGGLYWLTGNLVAPVVTHLFVNFSNLQYISDYDPLPAHGRWPADKRRLTA